MAKSSANRRRKGKGKGKRVSQNNVFDSSRSSFALSMVPSGSHRFLRATRLADLSQAAADQGFQASYLLSGVPNSSEFTALYDCYRIDKVEITFVFDLGSAATTSYYPRIVFAPDFNDSTPPTTETDVLQYSQARSYQFSDANRELTISIVPRVAKTVYRTAVTSAYGWDSTRTWLDTAYPDIPHFGLKFFVNNYNSTSFGGTKLRYYTRYFVTCANPK